MLCIVSYQLSTENGTELYSIGIKTHLEETAMQTVRLKNQPDVMYFQPEIYQTRDYKVPVPSNLNDIEQEYCAYRPLNCVSMEFEVNGTQIRMENGLNCPPNTVENATELFI